MSPVPVAQEPSHTAPTLRALLPDAVGEPFIDDRTPAGHFGVTVENIGGVQVYWLRGELGAPDARVVARTQYLGAGKPGMHYVGGGLFGGDLTVGF